MSSLPKAERVGHLPIPERMAKADLRKPDADWKTAVGRVIRQVRGVLSLKEFAAAICRDERQVARWEAGLEHAQIAAIFAVEGFRSALVIALAELAGLETETTIRARRSA